MDRWLTAVRYALEHPGSDSAEDMPQPPSREIFVFTPTGEPRILPAGATVLDFAFSIHSKLGSRCLGGKVNGKAVSIREKLATGDVVEILTGKNQKPAADWVNYVVTSKARTKIRQALSEMEFAKASDGKELLLRRLKNWKLEFPNEMQSEFMKLHHFTTVNGFFAAIGAGTLDVNVIKDYILSEERRHAEAVEAAKAAEAAKVKRDITDSHDDILVLSAKGVKGLDYKMARCCHPVFGDDVFGFVTRDAGIKIHRISCPNAARLIEMFPYRIQKVKWAETPSSGNFQANVKVTVDLDSGTPGRIMDIVNSFKASIRTFNVTENERAGTYEIAMKIAVPSNLELDKVISRIKQLKGVQKIVR